jgi:GNAT superfamily N-acetyltransferase
LAVGVAPWRDPQSAARAAEDWLADSFDAAGTGRGEVFVAVLDSAVVGVVSVDEQRHFTGAVDGCVGELAVLPTATRSGVGRRLMAAAEHWARARGLRHLLQTGAANEEARAFYRSLGYLEEEIRLTHSLTEYIESVVVNRSVAR